MSKHLSLTISRRQLLFGSGSLALLASAHATLPHVGSYAEPAVHLPNLSPKEAAVYSRLGRWLLPEGGPLPGHGGDDVTLAGIDSMLAGLPEGRRWLLSALPMVFEHGTALDHFGAERLTAIPDESAEAYLSAWARSASVIHAQLMAAAKALYGFAYFERPEVLASMQLTPHCRVVR